jgi:glutamate-1-semialdehyde 2,1-aminomutase
MNYKDRLHKVIPGGAHTYSRGDDQFPSNAPSILLKGEGAYVYDSKGEEYLDYGMGLRSVNIGYGNKEIADACYKEMLNGNNLTRASITELEAAELFVSLIPSVDMVKFAKHGSTVTTAAIKLARAYTQRKYIALPYEQPFFSFDDWFIGSTPISKGCLEETSQYTLKFNYNNIESLKELFATYPNQIAAVMLEPATSINPCLISCTNVLNCKDCCNKRSNFLAQVKDICHENNSLLILDEMITGFRWHLNGAQTFYGVEPDLCTFGKAMANGFAVAALGGKRDIMEIGGILKEGQERVFLTSTTHGAEMSALGAFIKTVEILKRENVINHYWNYGKKLIENVKSISSSLGLQEYFSIDGYGCSPNFVTRDQDGLVSLTMRTLFSQEMVKNKVLMPYIAISYSHQDSELVKTLNAIENSLKIYKKTLNEGVNKYLHSPIIKPVFRKFN